MKVLITGGAGFLGTWIVERLPPAVEIVVIDSLDPQVHKVSLDFPPRLKARARCIRADIQSIFKHKDSVEGTDVVIHLAAQTGTGQSMYEMGKYVAHNANGTAALLDCLSNLKTRPRRIILTSSRAVYGEGAYTNGRQTVYPRGRSQRDVQQGNWGFRGPDGDEYTSLPMREEQHTIPTSVYGLTKLWQEQLVGNFCTNRDVDFAILRLQNVYGPGQKLENPYTGIIGIFTNAVAQDNPVELFEDGEMTRDFVYAGDVAAIIEDCVAQAKPIASTINVGSGIRTTLRELVCLIGDLLGTKARCTVSGRCRVGDIRHAVADMGRYKSLFGKWSPTPLREGLRKYLDWYLSQIPPDHESLGASLLEMEMQGMLMVGATHGK